MKLWELYLIEAGFEDLPKGWSKKTVKKAGNTLAKTVGSPSPKSKGFFDKCVKRMRKHMGKGAEGYCASLKDESFGGDKASTMWRGKDKTKKEASKDIKMHRNVSTEGIVDKYIKYNPATIAKKKYNKMRSEKACQSVLDPKRKSKCKKQFQWKNNLTKLQHRLKNCQRLKNPTICKKATLKAIKNAQQKIKYFKY